WNLKTRAIVAELEPPDQARALAFQADGSGLLYLSRVGLSRWELDSDRVDSWPFPDLANPEDGRNIKDAAFDARRSRVAAATSRRFGEGAALALWELSSDRVRVLELRDRLGEPREPVALSRDGSRVAVKTFGGNDTQRVEGFHRLVAILSFATGETLNRERMP